MKNNKKSTKTTDTSFSLKKLEDILDLYLVKKAPGIPENIKEIIVKFSPYIIIVALLFSLPALFASLGLATLFSPMVFMSAVRYGFSFSGIFLIASLVLEIIALPGLFNRKQNGWKYLYYASLINAVYALLRFDLGSLIIGTAISLYILFQVKSYYKN